MASAQRKRDAYPAAALAVQLVDGPRQATVDEGLFCFCVVTEVLATLSNSPYTAVLSDREATRTTSFTDLEHVRKRLHRDRLAHHLLRKVSTIACVFVGIVAGMVILQCSGVIVRECRSE